MTCFALTDKGTVRRENQDVACVNDALAPGTALAVVCDGMGGARSGRVASQLAADEFMAETVRLLKRFPAADAVDLLNAAAERANRAVYERSRSDARYYGMGTTLVAALIRGSECCVLNIGDSRAYHITPEGIFQISRDHSVVENMVAKGDLTPLEARTHPNRNLITRALGPDIHAKADTFELPWHKDEFLLLCSDGLVNTVSDQEMLFEVLHDGDVNECLDHLLQISLQRGAPDNITAVLLLNEEGR